MKKLIIFIVIASSVFAFFMLYSGNNDYLKDAVALYQKIIMLNDDFSSNVEVIKSRKEASLYIDRFIIERQKLYDKLNELEKKYPDFRKDPALHEFETVLEEKTRKTANSMTETIKKNTTVVEIIKILDKMNHTVRLVTDRSEKTD